MLIAIYGAAAIFGGLLTLFSLFGAGDSSETSLDAAEISQVDPELPFSKRHYAAVFSLRNISIAALAFGAGGLSLGVTGLDNVAVLVCSIILGLLAGATSWYLLNYLLKSQSTSVTRLVDLTGRTAVVVVPVGKTVRGKVRVNGLDGTLPLAALLVSWSDLEMAPVGYRLVVSGFDDGISTVLLASDEDLMREENHGRN